MAKRLVFAMVLAVSTATAIAQEAEPVPAQPPVGLVPEDLQEAAPPAMPLRMPTAADGKAFLKDNCGSCHAVGATGESALATAPPFRAVVQRYPPEDLEESLAEGIMTGHPEMPQLSLSPDEIADVIAYLDALSLTTAP